MNTLLNLSSMTWMILIAAAIICTAVLFSKAIQLVLKVAVIVGMLLMVAYFLQQEGILHLP